MRASLRTSAVMLSALGLVPALALAQEITPEFLLTRYNPVFKGVEYDLPASALKGNDPAVKAAVEACKVDSSTKGFILKDGQGRTLRKFLDTNGQKTQRDGEKKPSTHLDQWSYYQDGFEVYREVDSDEDGSLDEVRWMNSNGTRVAKVRPEELKGGGRTSRIVGWGRISAEEASKVLVQAVVANDPDLLATVMATPEDLQAIGAPAKTVERVATAAEGRVKALAALRGKLVGWTAATEWARFDGAMPHVIPEDSAPGLKSEILLYENALIFPAPAEGTTPEKAAKMAFLSAADVIRVGETWKFLDLPQAIDPANPVGGALVSLRTDLLSGGGAIGGVTPPHDPKFEAAVKALTEFDQAGPPGPDAGKKAVAEWNIARTRLLYAVISAATEPTEKLTYTKQVIGNLAEAIRTGQLPDGMATIDKFVAQGGKVGSYAAYRKILVQFEMEMDEPGANYLEAQKTYLKNFEKYLQDFPQADEAPDVLIQLASLSEFNGDEDAAKTWYQRLAKDHPTTEAGKKAVGALKRMDLDGKPLRVVGQGTDGKPAGTDALRGKTFVVVYFRAGSSADQKELQELSAIREKLGAKGFDVLGVSLDDDKATLDDFLKAASVPWSTIFEPGGMESRPAQEMGIYSTTMMILVDGQGKVVNRKIRKAAEVEKALDRALVQRNGGANLGSK